jgi:hypothetical protein
MVESTWRRLGGIERLIGTAEVTAGIPDLFLKAKAAISIFFSFATGALAKLSSLSWAASILIGIGAFLILLFALSVGFVAHRLYVERRFGAQRIPLAIAGTSALVGAGITALIFMWIYRPYVSFHYAHEYPWYTSPQKRLDYKNYSVAVSITTNRLMRNAIPRLISISKHSDAKHEHEPINGYVEPTLGWAAGTDSFIPRTVGIIDWIVLFVISEDGKKLGVYFDDKHLPETEPLKSLDEGDYDLDVALYSDNLSAQEAKFIVHWRGTTYPSASAML